MIALIGSGPADVATTRALTARGFDVSLTDGGVSLEVARASLVDDFANRAPSDWPDAAIAEIRRKSNVGFGDVPFTCTTDRISRTAK